MAEKMDEALQEVCMGGTHWHPKKPHTGKERTNIESLTNPKSAVQIRPVVLHRQDGRRGISTSARERDSTVHRSVDGDGLGSDRYVRSGQVRVA